MINRHYLYQFLDLPASFPISLNLYPNISSHHHLTLCEAGVFQIQIQTRWKRHKVLPIRPFQQRRQRVPVSSTIQIAIGLVFGWLSAANTIAFPVHCLTHFTILQACIYSHTSSVVSGAGNNPLPPPRKLLAKYCQNQSSVFCRKEEIQAEITHN